MTKATFIMNHLTTAAWGAVIALTCQSGDYELLLTYSPIIVIHFTLNVFFEKIPKKESHFES